MVATPGQESTARPWKVGNEVRGAPELGTYIEAADRRTIAGRVAPHDAAYIVRSVNSYAAMLHALREAGTLLDQVLNGSDLPPADDVDAALKTIRAAIRAAEGGQ